MNIQPLDSRYGIFNLDVNWNSPYAPYANIVSSTSYSTQCNNSNQDNTPLCTGLLAEAIAPGLGLDNPNDVQLDKFSQELRVSSIGQGPLEWQVGGYYTVERAISIRATMRPALSNAGNPLPGTPKFRGALLGDYDWQLTGNMKAFVGATFFFTTARPNIYAVGYSPTGANNQGSIPNYGVIPIYNDAGGVIGDANDSLPGYRTLDLRVGLQCSAVTLGFY